MLIEASSISRLCTSGFLRNQMPAVIKIRIETKRIYLQGPLAAFLNRRTNHYQQGQCKYQGSERRASDSK